MRDIVLCLIIAASVPFVLRSPAVGIVMWIWLSVMNPHRLAYGFAYSLPLAAGIAGLTFVGLVFTKDERRLPVTPPVVMLALFMLWMCITSLFPYQQGSGYEMWSRVMKILLMTFVALAVIRTKKQIHWTVWITVLSLAYYGVKGGVFTLLSGGSSIVWGPEGSFIQGNNELALALVIAIPFMRYIQLGFKNVWLRRGMTGAMLLSALSALGSHSRGALLAIISIALFLWLKSRKKGAMGVVLIVLGIAGVAFMPSEWTNRMHTISTYDEDSSAMGRINAWWFAFNVAKSNFFGGGYEIWTPEAFARYAPNPIDWHAAHSIYFQILGEHGFIGLIIFMSIGACTWSAASDAKRVAKGIPGYEWIALLMEMSQVSMVGYAVGGAFLSLAYFDVPYYVIVIVVGTREIALQARRQAGDGQSASAWARRNRFGKADIVDHVDASSPSPSQGRGFGDDWRTQAGFRRQAISSKGADV